MPRAFWTKIIRELWINRSRTMLVVVAIAIGIVVFGTVAASRAILQAELARQYAASNPAHIILDVQPFNPVVADRLRELPAIASADARHEASVRIEVAPGEWVDSRLSVINGMPTVSTFTSEDGLQDRYIYLERSTRALFDTEPADTLRIQLPDGSEQTLDYGGTVHDLSRIPSSRWQEGYTYLTADTYATLVADPRPNHLRIRLVDNPTDRADIEATAAEIVAGLRQQGIMVTRMVVPEPDRHWAAGQVDGIVALMGVIGAVSLLMAAFLIMNTVSALMAQQSKQIGMLKAIGTRTWKVVDLYLVTVMCYGLLALIVALPLSIVGTRGLTAFISNLNNYDIATVQMPPGVVFAQVAMGLLLPLVAGLLPALSGARLTVKDALVDYGVGHQAQPQDIVARLLHRIQDAPGQQLLAIRNTFRQRGRLLLTLFTLTLAGGIFIAIFSARASAFVALDDTTGFFAQDVSIRFLTHHPADDLLTEARQESAVTNAEAWSVSQVQMVTEDDSLVTVAAFALNPDTPLMNPTPREGRFVRSTDDRAVAVTGNLRDQFPAMALGDTLSLTLEGEVVDFEIVGFLPAIPDATNPNGFVFMPLATYQSITGTEGLSNYVVMETDTEDLPTHREVLGRLESAYGRSGYDVLRGTAHLQAVITAESVLGVVITVMLLMEVLLGIVGGLSLMGSISLNVLERTREIGVLRALGSSNRTIMWMVMQEGLLVGVISALFGAIVAIPLARVLAVGIGVAFAGEPLPTRYSWVGVLLWVGVVLVIATVSSYVPARRAARITVADALAYL